MSTRSAKEGFTREEIIEILRQNLDLYREEPKFIEYFIELSLYLVDQAYSLRGERVSDLDSVMEKYREATDANQTPPPPPPFERMKSVEKASEAPAPERTPPPMEDPPSQEPDRQTNKLRLAALEAVMKAPPPPDADEAGSRKREGSTDRISLAKLRVEQDKIDGKKSESPEEPAEREPSGPSQRPEAFDLGSQVEEDLEDPILPTNDMPTRQLRSPAALTPEPQGGLNKERRSIELGRAKVQRSAHGGHQRRGPSNCPICGSEMQGRNICPSCGHIA